MSTSQDENLQSSRQLPSSEFLQGVSDPQAAHAEFNALPLATEYSLAAALAQLISLASLCMAISFVKWILLVPSKSLGKTVLKSSVTYRFGVPYKVEVIDLENITTKEWVINSSGVTGDTVLILMTSASSMSLIFGFVSFLLDFMDMHNLGNVRLTLASSLHILAGLFLLTLISICWWWFMTIDHWLRKVDARKFQLTIILGESFYLCLIALAVVIIAVILSCQAVAMSEERPDEDMAVSEELTFQRQTLIHRSA